MSYRKMECPGCGECILVNDRDGKGFCMLCGEELDVTGGVILPAMVEEIIDLSLEESLPGEEYPWYNDLMGAIAVLNRDGVDAAMGLFADLHRDDMGEEESNILFGRMVQGIVSWISHSLGTYDTAYRGGAIDLVEGIGPWFSDANLEVVLHSLDALKSRCESMYDVEDAAAVIVALYNVMYDLYTITTEPMIIAGLNEVFAGIQEMAVSVLEDFIDDDEDEEGLFDDEYMVNVIGETVVACDAAIGDLFSFEKGIDDIVQNDDDLDEAQEAFLSMMDSKASPEQAAGAANRYFAQVFRTE